VDDFVKWIADCLKYLGQEVSKMKIEEETDRVAHSLQEITIDQGKEILLNLLPITF